METTYGILLILDFNKLQQDYNIEDFTALLEIESILYVEYGFKAYSKCLYISEEANAVDCIVAVTKLVKKFNWFKPCIKSIRLLRIEENTDLLSGISEILD